jgi:hypothetical protein|tara:strand:- start:3124 stop:3486 length:363 start_codon:yes stop_codon:yes gene_type:complete
MVCREVFKDLVNLLNKELKSIKIFTFMIKDKKGLFGFFWLIIIFLIVGFFIFIKFYDFTDYESTSCVPSTCCHAKDCVLDKNAPDCDRAFCTEDCQPGTLDCGQGSCEYVDSKCKVVFNE